MPVSNRNNVNYLRGLSQIFTASNFEKIIRGGDKQFLEQKLKKCSVSLQTKTDYNNFIKEIYSELSTNYRTEYFFKNVLLNKFLLQKYSLKTTTVLNEFRIGASIADFVLLNGCARIFEIKTDLDNLEKLEKQLRDYSKFADEVFIVSSPRYIDKLLRAYSQTPIGIIEFRADNSLVEHKKANNNLEFFEHETIFKTLRQTEYFEIIRSLFGFLPDVPNTKIFRECLALAKEIEISKFQKLALGQLKRRRLTSPDFLSAQETPFELKYICHTLDLTSKEYNTLYKFLKTPI